MDVCKNNLILKDAGNFSYYYNVYTYIDKLTITRPYKIIL